ncbi:DUF4131 domain-containing protein [Micromonospora sp. NBC_00389]
MSVAQGQTQPPDLRLAGLAVATWLSALAGLHLGARPVLVLGGTAAGLTALSALHLLGRLGHPRAAARRYGWIAVAVGLGVVCGATATAARLVVRDAQPIRVLAEQRAPVTADLVVRDDPRPIRSAARPGMLLVPTELVRLTGPDGRRVEASVRLLILATDPAWRGLLPGQRLTAEGRLGVPRGGDLTAAVLSTSGPPLRHGVPSWAQRAAGTRTHKPVPAPPLPVPANTAPVRDSTTAVPAPADQDPAVPDRRAHDPTVRDRGPEIAALVPAARTAARTLTAEGTPLSRKALARQLRADGHQLSNATASTLVRALRAETTPPAPDLSHREAA